MCFSTTPATVPWQPDRLLIYLQYNTSLKTDLTVFCHSRMEIVEDRLGSQRTSSFHCSSEANAESRNYCVSCITSIRPSTTYLYMRSLVSDSFLATDGPELIAWQGSWFRNFLLPKATARLPLQTHSSILQHDVITATKMTWYLLFPMVQYKENYSIWKVATVFSFRLSWRRFASRMSLKHQVRNVYPAGN